MKFDRPGQWPPSPWENEEERDHAPMDAKWMGMEWPTGPAERIVSFSMDDRGGSFWKLAPAWRERVAVHLVLTVFWQAWEHAALHPQDNVTWRMTYDVEGPPDDPSPTHPWLEVRAEGPHGGQSLIPPGYDSMLLAEGLQDLGISPYKDPIQKGIPLLAQGDVRTAIEECLGKAYATWWHAQRLDQTIEQPPAPRGKVRM
jgi:hypothetical protein